MVLLFTFPEVIEAQGQLDYLRMFLDIEKEGGLDKTIVIIGHVMFEWDAHHFDAGNPPLALLNLLVLCVNFLGIGYFATRFPRLQGAFVCFMGSMIVTVVDYLPAIYPGRHYWPRAEMLASFVHSSYPLGLRASLPMSEHGSEIEQTYAGNKPATPRRV